MKIWHRIQDALLQVALQPRQLAKSLGRWMPGVGSRLTVLLLDGRWLKALQVEGRTITHLLTCPVEGKGPEEVLKIFHDACQAEGMAVGETLIANPTHLSTIRLFTLPSVDPNEVRDIVELQAEKHTPYAKEEILTDFIILEKERGGYSRVLLVIAHQDVVHRSVRLAELSNVMLERVACEAEGLVNWFHAVRRGEVKVSSSAAVLVIEVDGTTTTLLVMQRGQPYFHRNFAFGMEQLHQDPTQAGQRLVGELQRSIEAVEAEAGAAKITDILLTGRVERLQELKTLIESGLNLPVHVAAPWAGAQLSETAAASAERLPDLSFASLVGLALAPSRIDLTPKASKLRQVFESRARAVVVVACQVSAVLVLVSLFVIGRALKEQRYYQQLQKLYQANAPAALKIEEGFTQINFVRERLRHQGELLNLVDALAKLSPKGVQWDALTFTQGEALILKGESEALPRVYEFVASLSNAGLFGTVPTPRVSQRKTGEGEQGVTDFEIRCPLVPPKKS